ncbi:MAG: TRAP transporter small permease [Burkholderiales bacterium]|nr:TRAP transporter small permease [Burkholderiales bacterium]MBK8664668.1 TRAP transporter small permease [Burkholderiales bacterium]
MATGWRTLPERLHRLAEAVAAALLAIIFVAFLVQIAMRYLFDLPVGWTSEVSLMAWLWLVLWGASLALREHDEIRLDLITDHARPRIARAAKAIAALGVLLLFAISLPATWSYVSFMKVESSSYLGIRMDWAYSIYLLFAVGVIVRSAIALWRALRGPVATAPVEERVHSL